MENLKEKYTAAFAALGRNLEAEDAIPDEEMNAAQNELAMTLPKALRDFYEVAGRASDYTCVFNQLFLPNEWEMDCTKLIFMAENQAVVIWGTDASGVAGDDPPVYQAENAEELDWEQVNDRCSVFLCVMLHWEAAFGGAMPHAGTAIVDANLVKLLDREWSFVGEVNQMRAYNKPGKAICILEWEDHWRIFAGTTTIDKMHEIRSELKLDQLEFE